MISANKNSLFQLPKLPLEEWIDDRIKISASTTFMLEEMKSFFKEEKVETGHKTENFD